MSKKKSKPIIGQQRENLILALSMHDMVSGINTVMRNRKLTFVLDYSQGHFPQLFVHMPGCDPERFMHLDQRKHYCYIVPPKQRDLFAALADITERLHKHGGRLSLTGDKPKQGPMRCMLQVYVDGVRRNALTLMSTTKGKAIVDTDFQLPDGTTP